MGGGGGGGGGGLEETLKSCCNTVHVMQNSCMQAIILWGARLPLRILEGPGPLSEYWRGKAPLSEYWGGGGGAVAPYSYSTATSLYLGERGEGVSVDEGETPLDPPLKSLIGQQELSTKTITYSIVLGRGAFAVVFKAKCDELPCAAKILHTIFHDPGLESLKQHF